MISAVHWIPKGAARAEPKTYEPTEEELEAAKRSLGDEVAPQDDDEDEEDSEDEDMMSSEEEEEEEEGKDAAVARAKAMAESIARERAVGDGGAGPSSAAKSIEDALAELDMDHYDSEEEEPLANRIMGQGKGRSVIPPEEDEYMNRGGDSDDDAESIEDLQIKDSDLVLVAARNEDDVSHLEVYVYEEETETEAPNMYVHHDIMLAAFPLCLAWMDLDPAGTGDRGNFVAVGTFDPAIEIWDLDMMDALEPVRMLGGVVPEDEEEEAGAGGEAAALSAAEKKKLKKKKSKAKAKAKAKTPTFQEGSHTDAVMSLSWNQTFRNVLASGSADCVVKVWDVVKGTCERSLRHHAGKVQSVCWNPVEATALLTGGYDRVVALADMREGSPDPLKWKVAADVESLMWHPHEPTAFLVSTEDGMVTAFDARNGPSGQPLFRLHAHDKATCSMSFNPAIPGLLATCSTDKKVKLWDVRGNTPSLVAQEDLQVGACFTLGFCPSQPFLLAAGGAKGLVSIWDLLTSGPFAQRYGNEIRQLQQTGQVKVDASKVEKAEAAAAAAAAAAPAERAGKKKKKGVKV